MEEISYPFSNFNGYSTGVWEWIGNFIQHFVMYELTDIFWGYNDLTFI